MPHLHGERIRLRAAEREDIPVFLNWINDEEVTENLELIYPISRAEEEQWFENMIAKPTAEHVMVIEIPHHAHQGSFMPIGNCRFFNINWRNRSAEIGIMIGEKSFWDQGYGTETMQCMLKYGFNSLNLHRIYLRVFEHNERGIHVYEKVGFKSEGKQRQAHYLHGKYHDVYMMSVLKNEWCEGSQQDKKL